MTASSPLSGQADAKRILVVEDNLDTMRSLVLLLRDMGHHVEYAINGYAALEVARKFPPEFVLLDLGLPGMTGFETCRHLLELSPHMRIVSVTGYAQDEYRERALAAGCERHLVKPVNIRVLSDWLATKPGIDA